LLSVPFGVLEVQMATRMNDIEDEGRGRRQMQVGRVLGLFYAGGAVPCPVGCGGASEVVRVGALATGAGELWVECGSCAQRGRFAVPVATEPERRAVESALRDGKDVSCPRHAYRAVLQRRGRGLVCPDCGVRYRE